MRRKTSSDIPTQDACEDCGSTEEVDYVECPYVKEIYDEIQMHWLCPNCKHERAMDI